MTTPSTNLLAELCAEVECEESDAVKRRSLSNADKRADADALSHDSDGPTFPDPFTPTRAPVIDSLLPGPSLQQQYADAKCRTLANQILGQISSLQALIPLSTKAAAAQYNSGPAASLLPLILHLPLADLVGLQASLISSQSALLVLRALIIAGNPPPHVRSIFATIRSLDLNVSRRIALEPTPPADMKIADILSSNTRAGYHAFQLLILNHSFNLRGARRRHRRLLRAHH
jgi:hypothetical protein